MPAIKGEDISFSYDLDGDMALKEVSLQIEKGEFVAILGPNGCGKSTLARHLNALLPLQAGHLQVLNIDVTDEKAIYTLRRMCGMVFQNPDNQFVSSIVAEDVAFGLRNYGTPEGEISLRVAAALDLVDMSGSERRHPHTLSGGQKQRVAMAGVLAMEPDILIFDEATAMLDPDGRREVLAILHKLRGMGKTILLITHYVEEAVSADRLILMRDGVILADDTPRKILTDETLLQSAGMLPPVAVRLYHDLRQAGIRLGNCPLTNDELVEELCRLK